MRRTWNSALGAALLGLALAAGTSGAAPAEDATALATVEKAIAALSSVRAEFVQELLDKDGKSLERAVGTLYLKKPGRFRWDYTEPKQLIVSDGETLWLYDPELEQATVRKVKDTLSQTPAMLLAGQSKVADGFTELYINYLGACKGCPSASIGTLSYIEQFLQKELDPNIRVLPL